MLVQRSRRKQGCEENNETPVIRTSMFWREQRTEKNFVKTRQKPTEVFVHRPRFDWLIRDHDQVLKDFWFTLIAQVLI